MTKWGASGSKMGKDPQRKRIPRTWTKRKVSSDPNPYQKKMS
jgi:hypothetical protein